MKGNGTKIATSSGDESVRLLTISCAREIASPLVEGFNFQLPVMKGFLSNNSVEAILLEEGLATNADVDFVRTRARDAEMEIFMVGR
jgi:hypothetical protein